MNFYTLKDFDLQNISPEKLGEILVEAKKAYYTTDRPIMDDHTFDILEDILRQKYPYHRLFQKVGHPNFDSGFEKKKHQMAMGSQNKVSTFSDLTKYFNLKKIPPNTQFIVQPKCDGISLEVIYQNGQLVEAITRGDGEIGDVVTQNISRMKNFQNKAGDYTGSVRFEIVVTYQDFKKLNVIASEAKQSLKTDRHDPSGLAMTYSNPRNAASGLTQRLDGKYTEYCSLFAVDIGTSQATEFDQINYLKKLGFTVVDSWLCRNYQEIENIYQQFISHQRKSYPYDIDGLIIKINDTHLQQQLGSQNNRPKGQVAYKFPASSNSSRVLAIDWQVGPLGTITPVAQIEPVEISGAIITYASLANIDLIEEKGININDIVEVSRRGDVIPHIDNVITKVSSGHALAPTNCPQCHTVLIRDHKFLKCPNPDCPAQNLGLLRLFCHTLDIKGISEKTITKLVSAGKLKLPGDFFLLQPSDISQLENLGEKSAQNIINQIQAKKVLTVVKVFQSASIPNLSQARIKQLIKTGYNTPEKLLNISISDLESVSGIQSTLANKIYAGLQLRRQSIISILNQVDIIHKSYIVKHISPISGLSFCITGSLSQPRKKIEEAIEDQGGQIQSAVSQTTSYLVTNDQNSGSSKIQSAKKYNVPIITEKQLNDLLISNQT